MNITVDDVLIGIVFVCLALAFLVQVVGFGYLAIYG